MQALNLDICLMVSDRKFIFCVALFIMNTYCLKITINLIALMPFSVNYVCSTGKVESVVALAEGFANLTFVPQMLRINASSIFSVESNIGEWANGWSIRIQGFIALGPRNAPKLVVKIFIFKIFKRHRTFAFKIIITHILI